VTDGTLEPADKEEHDVCLARSRGHSDPVGAEVRGVDLAAVKEADVTAIKTAWYRHDVLASARSEGAPRDASDPDQGFGGAQTRGIVGGPTYRY
jgi:alpha-ketoglutarate-dependent taurine dioxygenase